jgi:hypothetical protein
VRQLLSTPRGIALALAVLVLVGGALRADRAANPTTAYQSADERSYGYLALQIADHGTYGDKSDALRKPLHWPPGAPFMFAVAHKIDPGATDKKAYDIPAAYWAQAIVGTALIAVVFGIGLLLAGPLAGLLAAAAVAVYPPLIMATGEQLSEPLGALALALAFLALAWGFRKPSWSRFFVSGLLFGATALVRADLLLAGGIAALAVLIALWRDTGWRHATAASATVLVGTVVAVTPWVVHASSNAHHFVPVTEGSASALFVGTYLPGNGTTVGMKRDLGDATRKRYRTLHAVPDLQLPAKEVLDLVAARHRDISRDSALRKETKHNLRHYALGQPVDFARMMGDKVARMWGRYARGGAAHTSTWIRGWHIALVGVAFAGLLAGLWRRRDPVLAAILAVLLYSTLLHTLVVSQARYNLPLVPVLVAGGISGLVIALRGRRSEASLFAARQDVVPVGVDRVLT